MSANLSTKAPDAPLDKPAENKFDRFRPDMPKIPGVSQDPRQAAHGAAGMPSQRMIQIGGVAAAVLTAADVEARRSRGFQSAVAGEKVIAAA